jgi:trk system potassium uptake protein TrkA
MADSKRFMVIGLGSFGTALAARLARNGGRVTGIDADRMRVEALKEILYEAIIADATDREALQHLPVSAVEAVFISLGEDITRSILAALHCLDLNARNVIVKGVTREHGKILRKMGVDRVIFPETEIAEQLADRMTWPNVIDFLPIGEDYNFVEVAAPDSLHGKTLQEINLRRRFGVWVVGVKDAMTGKLEMFPDGLYRFGIDQILLVVGKAADVARLKELS